MPQKKSDGGLDYHENISLKLKNYNYMFSDFDPRPYSERALSVDFLDEARRASIDKPSGGLELRLLVPARVRRLKDESVIKKRLKAHFYKHASMIKQKQSDLIRSGLKFIACGIALMFFTTLVLFGYSKNQLLAQFLLVLFEPAGWFFFWGGLDQVVFGPKKTLPELEFYRKMSKADIGFFSVPPR